MMQNNGLFQTVKDAIEASSTVSIFGHEWPDGDAIGAAFALGLSLRSSGRQVAVSWPIPADLPETYRFLPGSDLFVPAGETTVPDLVISVDCATPERLGALYRLGMEAKAFVNIDHHADNTGFGTINCIDPDAPATCEILFRIFRQFSCEITREMALCLYTGIVTDTGRFQFSNTNAAAFKAAYELVKIGARPNLVYENIFQSYSYGYLRLLGAVLSRVEYDSGSRLVFSVLRQEDLTTFGVSMKETEGLIDFIRTVQDHRVAAIFKEQPDGSMKVSVRSKPDINIGKIAAGFGGGGHPFAAGYSFDGITLLEAVERLKGEIIASGRRDPAR